MRRVLRILGVISGLVLTACHKDESSPPPPAAQTINQTSTSTTGTGASSTSITTTTTTTLPPGGSQGQVIFLNELVSGGGAFLFPSGENQALSFNDTSSPTNGTSIRYAWNGQNVGAQHVFTGMDLMHTPQFVDYATTPGKDLQSGSFTRVVFDARGSLTTDTVVKVEVSDDGNPVTPAPCVILSANGQQDDSTPPGTPATCQNLAPLQGTWQRYTIPVTAANLASVKDFFKATFVFKGSGGPGGGGVIFVNNIVYQR